MDDGHVVNYWNGRADAWVKQERVTPDETIHIDDFITRMSR